MDELEKAAAAISLHDEESLTSIEKLKKDKNVTKSVFLVADAGPGVKSKPLTFDYGRTDSQVSCLTTDTFDSLKADAGPKLKADAEAKVVKAAKTNLRKRMYPYYVERRRLLEKNGRLSKANAYDIARDFLKANPEVKNDIPLNDKELLDWIYSSVGQRYNREKKKSLK